MDNLKSYNGLDHELVQKVKHVVFADFCGYIANSLLVSKAIRDDYLQSDALGEGSSRSEKSSQRQV